MTTPAHELGNIGNTRTVEQAAAYGRTIGEGACPFCIIPAEIHDRMICVGSHWRAWYNPFPYSGHGNHIMLAPLEHISQPGELSPEAWSEWGALVSALIERFELPGGGLVMRFGENSYNGGSLTHLHSHIQVPDKTGYAIAVFFADDRLKAFFKG